MSDSGNDAGERRGTTAEGGAPRARDSDDLTAEQVLEDAADLFGAETRGSPASDADAPAPPG